ncbi:MAG: cobalamin-binding protein [Acidobacteriia bacterium]|nr:cobalamin-binding protein [Terriglobia bacterium]
MKIVSLLPSATEIVYALGLGDDLVAVSHECDFPVEARSKPRITRALVDSDQPSETIDHEVREKLHEAGTLYDLDFELLKRLQPDLILTQQLCSVCAVSYDYVKDAVKGLVHSPRVVNLEPMRLQDIFENIRTVARMTGCSEQGEAVISLLQRRVERVRSLVSRIDTRPRTFLMEWLHPPFSGGHWNGELVEIAGGVDRIAKSGQPSRRVECQEILDFAAEIVVISCCGFSIDRTLREVAQLKSVREWQCLPAVLNQHVFIADGNQYFSRPGPRIIDSLEMLAVMIHPELASEYQFPPVAFRKLHTNRQNS